MAADMQKLIEQLGALTAAVSSTSSPHTGAAGPVAASGYSNPAPQPDPFSQMAQQMLSQNPNASFSDLMAQMQNGGGVPASVAPQATPAATCSDGRGAECVAVAEVQALREEVARLTTVIDGMMSLLTTPAAADDGQ